ncbi:hypothetical protein ACXOJ5_02455 [Streptococcus thermophilus]|uniref:hypothetical protein n=1 Tax=Streptococcus thermophilus TaxID=1308 RepID=UPI0022EB0A75|nr:hypothetical protein [Streptococcus thermophilus]MCE2078409.1 hypothetical protein [Streptococcus thermophilus]MDA3720110.1 hypothetical protein [Streptococcus thermophilus]MDA3770623.1 hypothetical protein [Streptococcus thermophilus]
MQRLLLPSQAFLLKSTAEPLHEMLSMKLPAELFTGTGKTRKKETVDPSFFDCLGIGATFQK